MSDQVRIRVGDWLVTPGRNLLERPGQSIRVEPRVMDVLVHLARNPGRVVSVDDLVTAVWQGAVVTDHSVYLAISQLRQVLGGGQQGMRYIETIRKRGYRLIVPVAPLTEASGPLWSNVDNKPRRHSPIVAWTGMVLAAPLIGVAILALFDGQDEAVPTGPPKVAVLPCENLSPDPNDAYFAAGIHEEILNRLAQLGGLSVIARTSVLPYANSGLSIRQIATDLDVSAVMECSVRYAGDKILVTGQLIDPDTDSHLWSNSYQGDRSSVSELFAMQADIATNIARMLNAELTPSEERRVARAGTDSMEAYAQILKLFEAYRRYGPPESLFAYVDTAIAADPDYAFAYAARGSLHLASANAASIVRAAAKAPDPERQHRLELANDDALRALEIDPQLGIAYSILGALSLVEGDRELARQRFEHALELSPGDPLVLRQCAVFEASENHLREALELMERARRLDPSLAEPIMYAIAGEYDLARRFAQDAIDRNPLNPSGHLAIALLDATIFNDAESAERALRLVEELAGEDAVFFHQTTQLLVAYVYGRLGLTSDARRVYDDALAALPNEQALTPAARMRAHLALEEVDEAYEWAVRMVETPLSSGQPAPLVFMHNTFNDPAFERPEFVELRRRMGYPD